MLSSVASPPGFATFLGSQAPLLLGPQIHTAGSNMAAAYSSSSNLPLSPQLFPLPSEHSAARRSAGSTVVPSQQSTSSSSTNNPGKQILLTSSAIIMLKLTASLRDGRVREGAGFRSALRRYPARKKAVVPVAAKGSSDKESNKDEEDDFSLIDMLIKNARNANEIGICTRDWHSEIFDSVPEGYVQALEAGIDLVEVLAGSTALNLLASAITSEQPRYCVRIVPKQTFGLGYILSKQLVHHYTVLGPLQAAMGKLNVASVETVTIHSDSSGRMSFPSWVYDAIAQAYERGLCTRVGVSHRRASIAAVQKAREEFQRRGVSLSCVYTELSLLDREALPLIAECRAMGVQVYATEILGPQELASGRFTASNPTGGEVSIPRFTLAQLLPLRPLHEAINDVARKARQRCEKPEIDSTQVALQWVMSKGASPLCDVSTDVNAKAVANCSGWKLTADEVKQLDIAADEVAKTRPRW